MKMNIERKRRRGRPKMRWLDTIENDIRAVDMCTYRGCGKLKKVV